MPLLSRVCRESGISGEKGYIYLEECSGAETSPGWEFILDEGGIHWKTRYILWLAAHCVIISAETRHYEIYLAAESEL